MNSENAGSTNYHSGDQTPKKGRRNAKYFKQMAGRPIERTAEMMNWQQKAICIEGLGVELSKVERNAGAKDAACSRAPCN